jgi:hypothetical protein
VADAPWRCAQCGTVNEPVANACRTCGRWPSLFELEGSTIEVDQPAEVGEALEPHEPVDLEEPEPDVFDAGLEDVPLPPEFVRLVVPIAIALYLLVSALLRS